VEIVEREWNEVEARRRETGGSMTVVGFGFLFENWKDLSHWLPSNGQKSTCLNGPGQD
jgi:hypothetical protein